MGEIAIVEKKVTTQSSLIDPTIFHTRMFTEPNESDDADAAPNSYAVILESPGNRKLEVVKAVREFTGLSLKESVELVELAPTIIKNNLSMDEAETIQRKLQKAGAKVSID